MKCYETVIGLEIHAELKTASKLFCSCPSRFGSAPNTDICPICMGHPGTMPTINRHAVMLAIRAGEALGCQIHPSRFDRKHYAYPDLPKAYQITQFYHPICTGGAVMVDHQTFRITRIHIEEDAGKLFHEAGAVKADYNRCGVPLIEIVTEPDFRTAEQASAFCRKLREILLFADVCDGRMNEGSLRCDVNLSLHEPGTPFGERTEIKNLNSFKFIEKAIRAEEARQRAILEGGGTVTRQTLRFDEKTEQTVPMRDKEDAADYRYFPEPDLPPLFVEESEIARIRADMPEHPDRIRERFATEYGLSGEVIEQGMVSPTMASRLEKALCGTAYKPIGGRLYVECVKDGMVDSEHFASLCALAGREEITLTDAKKLAALLTKQDFDPAQEAEKRGMRLISDPERLAVPILQVLRENPDKVAAYREGKTALLGFFIGAVKKRLNFPSSPKLLSEMLRAKLEQTEETT